MTSIFDSLSNLWSGTPNYTISGFDPSNKNFSIDLSQYFNNGLFDTNLSGGLSLQDTVANELFNAGYGIGGTEYQNALSQLNSDSFGANTGGITGLVDSLGGWGNVLSGVGQLGNLFMGISQLGLMQDSLDLANSQYNTSKALAQANLNNSVQAYNTSMADRMRARAKAETGDSTSYNDQIEERKLSSVSL